MDFNFVSIGLHKINLTVKLSWSTVVLLWNMYTEMSFCQWHSVFIIAHINTWKSDLLMVATYVFGFGDKAYHLVVPHN